MNIIDSRYGKLFSPETDDLIGISLTTYGEWAQNEIWLLEKLIRPGNTVLDVGAYIGTHTLAFSEFVGPNGLVHSFEPQAAAFSALEKCVNANGLRNTSLHQYALGENYALVEAKSTAVTIHNAGSFSLLNAKDAREDQPGIVIKTLDSLTLSACDFIKADAEGMEICILRGGSKTISKFRPMIACECNFLETGTPLLQWSREQRYDVFGVEFNAFNSCNHFRQMKNIYGNAGEILLILIPTEQVSRYKTTLSNSRATEIKTVDELAFILLRKPQYLAEAKANLDTHSYKISDESTLTLQSNSTSPSTPASKPQVPRSLRVVVPFYKNPQLVRPLFTSLVDCAEELRSLGARLFFYNDSPDDLDLHIQLEKCLRDKRLLDLTIVENPENLGFVGTVNCAFKDAIQANEDIVLLNSDTYVFHGLFTELAQVAYSDPMIGFVSPRSNNATICTLPHDSELADLSPEEGFAYFRQISRLLPRTTYSPTAVGFCMFIKWSIVAELGGFDTVYGRGYNEENDLVMRANKLGYRAALANHAFAWHQGEQSFGSLDNARTERERENAKLLHSRYPEYPALIQNYFHSAEYRAEKLLGTLCIHNEKRLRIGFDLTHFGTYYNGTFEAGKRLLDSAAKCWPNDIEIVVYISKESWDFHQLHLCPRLRWVDTHAPNEEVSAIVRIGQPYDADSLRRMLVRAPVVSTFMLDTISSDCGYLKVQFDETLWHFVLRWFDIVFTNSEFTANQFRRRYSIGEHTLIYPSLHSTTPTDYFERTKSEPFPTLEGTHLGLTSVIVIGNTFAHKALITTVEKLAEALPNLKITALGCADLGLTNVTCIPSGALTEQELDALYNQATAVIFPSHYEGFGFPIMHALARCKPIYVRKLPAFEEVFSKMIIGQQNIRWFETTANLIDQIDTCLESWQGPMAEGEPQGWDRSAREILSTITSKLDTVSQQYIADRLRWFELAFKIPTSISPQNRSQTELATRLITAKFSSLAYAALSNRIFFVIARFAWRLLKRTQ